MALRAVRYHGNLGGAIARFEYGEWQERFLVASSALWLSQMHQQNSTAAMIRHNLRND